jgi:iron complex outermembrane recepter protein
MSFKKFVGSQALFVACLLSATALSPAGVLAADAPSGGVRIPPVEAVGSPLSLTVPTTEQATIAIQRTPGGVEVVPDTVFKRGPANTIGDILQGVPGVIFQQRWGPDGRLSIRGSGLTRSYGNRGLNPLMDGIPISTADGLFDLFEVDPTAYRYVEVFKGANALRYGANSLGGAINFVMPTGRDALAFDSRLDIGSFGYVKAQTSTGGASGPWDWFITVSGQREDGYRNHSQTDSERLNANLGYQFSADAETRFYLNLDRWRAELPGEVSKMQGLTAPTLAESQFLLQNQQRNIDSLRVSNKTTLRFGPTTVEFGVFGLDRHVVHPIFQFLDYHAFDYGTFIRGTDDRVIGGFHNILIGGVNVHNGSIPITQNVDLPGGIKGPLAASWVWNSQNLTVYGEDSFYFLPKVALVAGVQYLHAVRDQKDRFLTDGNQSGRHTWDLITPKVGLLWDVDPAWQVFGNVSASAEVPTYDVNTFASPISSNVTDQTAVTYEIGTRGHRPNFNWDISLYRAEIHHELQCLTTGPYSPCTTVNADRTVHQGIEAGIGVAVLKSVFATGDSTWFNLTYTLNDFHFVGDKAFGNNRLPGVAPHNIHAELMYTNPKGFYVAPNIDWVPVPFYSDNANTLSGVPYVLLNVKAGYDLNEHWSGYVEGRNLLDKRYLSTTVTVGTAAATSELFNPGYGRSIYGGLRYKF